MPENKNGCNCCPYGYHIDLDFVDFIECVNKGLDSRKKEVINFEKHQSGKNLSNDTERPFTKTSSKYESSNQVYATPYANMGNDNFIPRPSKLSNSPNSRSLEDISKTTSSYINSNRDRSVISPVSRIIERVYSPTPIFKTDVLGRNGPTSTYSNLGYGGFRSATTTPTKHYYSNAVSSSGYHSDYGERYNYPTSGRRGGTDHLRSTMRSPSRVYSSGYDSSIETTQINSKPDYFTAVAQTMSQIRSKSNPGTPRHLSMTPNSFDVKKNYASKPPLPPSSTRTPLTSSYFDSNVAKRVQVRSTTPINQHPYRSGNIKTPLQKSSSTVYEKDHYFPTSSLSNTERDVNSNYRSYTSNNSSQTQTGPSRISTLPLQSYTGSKSYTGSSLIDGETFASIRREKQSQGFSSKNGLTSSFHNNLYDGQRIIQGGGGGNTNNNTMTNKLLLSPTMKTFKSDNKKFSEHEMVNDYNYNTTTTVNENNKIPRREPLPYERREERKNLDNKYSNKNIEEKGNVYEGIHFSNDSSHIITNDYIKNDVDTNNLKDIKKEEIKNQQIIDECLAEIKKRDVLKKNVMTMVDDELKEINKKIVETYDKGINPIESILYNEKNEIINEYINKKYQLLKEIEIQTEKEEVIKKYDIEVQTNEIKKETKNVCCGIQLIDEGFVIIKKSELDIYESRSARLENLEKEIAEAAMRKAELQAKQEAEDAKMKAIEMAARAEAELAMKKAMEAMQMKEATAVMKSVDEEEANEDEDDAEIISLTQNDEDEDLSYVNPTPDYSLSINGLSTGSSESDSESECLHFKKNSLNDDLYYERESDNDDTKDIELLEFEREELNAMKEEETKNETKEENNNKLVDSEQIKEKKEEEKAPPKLLSPEKTESLKKLLTDTSVNSFHRGDTHRSFRLTKSNANDLSIIAEKHTNESGDVVQPTSAVHDPRAVLAGKVDLKKDASLGSNSYMNGLTPIPINFPNMIPRPKITRFNVSPGKAENKEEEEEATDRVMPLPSEMRKFGYFKERNVYNDRRYRYLTAKKAQQKEMEDDDDGSQSSDTSEDLSPDDSTDSIPVEPVKYEVKVPLQEALGLMLKFVENPGNITPSVADWAIKYVKHEWMRLTTKEDTDIDAIATLLEYIRGISVELLKSVVNLCDQNDNTALHFAIANSKFDVVSVLLDSHVCEMDKPNKAGYSAIMIGATTPTKDEAHASIIDRLFRSGDVNARSLSHGQTALMLAVSCNNVPAVKALLDLGADVNIQDFEGSTALMVVAEHGHVELAKLLLDHPDIDTSTTDCDEQTALSIAVGNKYHSIAALIYAYNNHTLKKKDPSIQ